MMGTREAPFRPERICILPSSHFGCKTPGITPKRAPMNVLGVKTPFLHPKSALTPPEGTAAERREGYVGFARAEWAGRKAQRRSTRRQPLGFDQRSPLFRKYWSAIS